MALTNLKRTLPMPVSDTNKFNKTDYHSTFRNVVYIFTLKTEQKQDAMHIGERVSLTHCHLMPQLPKTLEEYKVTKYAMYAKDYFKGLNTAKTKEAKFYAVHEKLNFIESDKEILTEQEMMEFFKEYMSRCYGDDRPYIAGMHADCLHHHIHACVSTISVEDGSVWNPLQDKKRSAAILAEMELDPKWKGIHVTPNREKFHKADYKKGKKNQQLMKKKGDPLDWQVAQDILIREIDSQNIETFGELLKALKTSNITPHFKENATGIYGVTYSFDRPTFASKPLSGTAIGNKWKWGNVSKKYNYTPDLHYKLISQKVQAETFDNSLILETKKSNEDVKFCYKEYDKKFLTTLDLKYELVDEDYELEGADYDELYVQSNKYKNPAFSRKNMGDYTSMRLYAFNDSDLKAYLQLSKREFDGPCTLELAKDKSSLIAKRLWVQNELLKTFNKGHTLTILGYKPDEAAFKLLATKTLSYQKYIDGKNKLKIGV
jgi:hypothetical protein